MQKLNRQLFASYGTLSTSFVEALNRWKPQTISFLDLPGEIRNHIYNLCIPNTDEYFTELGDLTCWGGVGLPPSKLMFTCKRVQKELAPLYFRTINLRFCYDDYDNLRVFGKHIHSYDFEAMKIYDELDPSITDYLRSIQLQSTAVGCKIHVTDPKVVQVELCTFGGWIKSSALTHMSIAIRNKIINSLANSPTGLLGVRHLLLAVKEIGLIQEWCKWRRQEFECQVTRYEEAPRDEHEYLDSCDESDCYKCYLIAEAEKEGLSKLIPAVSFTRPGHLLQRNLWKITEKEHGCRNSTEAEGDLSEQQWWLYEGSLIEKAERKEMPRLIRAATPPLDAPEMYV